MVDSMITPQEISKHYSISYQTINYYTNLGLLVVRKKQGNSRLYDPSEVKKSLARITDLKNQGYSLKLICSVMRQNQ